MRRSTGFMAVTAVILLATGTLAFSLATMFAATAFADSVNRRELRIQARLNATACLDTLELVAAKDYFLNGEVKIPELGCTAQVWNDHNGVFSFEASAVLEGVTASLHR